MAATPPETMHRKRAREILGVSPLATAVELRLAFREAAKQAHPDRPGGDAERFREAVEAYRLLSAPKITDSIIQPPATVVRPARTDTFLNITPLLAMNGGELFHQPAGGRRLKIRLPEGLRTGDTLRVGETEFEISVRSDGEMLVRGDDLWLTVPLDPGLLAQGGRVALDTPLGRRVVWITRKAGERGLVRLVGQGLPARGPHRQGHLFLRLAAQVRTTDSAARTLRRRFAAAWAA